MWLDEEADLETRRRTTGSIKKDERDWPNNKASMFIVPDRYAMNAAMAWKGAVVLAALALGIYLSGCNELLGEAGNWQQCTVTGRALSANGSPLKGIDVHFVPEGEVVSSSNIRGVIDGASFTLSHLNVPEGAERVEGLLVIEEVPPPPFQVEHDPLRVEISASIERCDTALGDLTLTPRGEADE